MGKFLFYTKRKILRLVARCEYHIEKLPRHGPARLPPTPAERGARWYGSQLRFGTLQMKIVSQCRKQAKWVYNCPVFKAIKEISDD